MKYLNELKPGESLPPGSWLVEKDEKGNVISYGPNLNDSAMSEREILKEQQKAEDGNA